MPGFFGIVDTDRNRDLTNFEIPLTSYTPVICGERSGQNFYFKRFVIPKFMNDKLFDENNKLFICTDGILLNSKNLKLKYQTDTNFNVLNKIYTDKGITGISEIKGDFSGFIFNKDTNLLHIFTNHIGSKNIFYFFDEEKNYLVFGSELKILVNIMRKMGYTPSLSETGAYCLLTFGFMLGDNSLVKNIKKIPPGSILTYSDGHIKIDQYFKLSSTPYLSDSEEVIIKNLDSLFSEAIKLEYDKDLEYNYSHVSTLSGGLDSRMNIMHAEKAGYSNILCVCFSQSDYLDEIIAKRIASDHGFDFLFHFLDNGNYLKNVDESVLANDGLVLYPGSSPMQFTFKLIDWNKLGLLHTGMLGDLIMGSYLLEKNHTPVDNPAIKKSAYSTRLLNKDLIEKLQIPRNYENSELFAFYERCVNGVFNGYRITEHFTEFSSPFLDKDFLEYAMRMPTKYRYNEGLYLKWILSKVPEAAAYPWEHTGVKINAGLLKKMSYRIYRFIFKKLLRNKMHKDAMNPADYWYQTNPGLRHYIEDYFNNNINLLNKHPTLMKDARKLFSEGTFIEKAQVLTLLSAIKLHSLYD
jgi:asparagine synthase (glutamine-hydrolysing)